MAKINIAERRITQDGRISITVGGKSIDMSVATLDRHVEKMGFVSRKVSVLCSSRTRF